MIKANAYERAQNNNPVPMHRYRDGYNVLEIKFLGENQLYSLSIISPLPIQSR